MGVPERAPTTLSATKGDPCGRETTRFQHCVDRKKKNSKEEKKRVDTISTYLFGESTPRLPMYRGNHTVAG